MDQPYGTDHGADGGEWESEDKGGTYQLIFYNFCAKFFPANSHYHNWQQFSGMPTPVAPNWLQFLHNVATSGLGTHFEKDTSVRRQLTFLLPLRTPIAMD